MKRIDFFYTLALTVLALFIWFKDRTWMSSPEDTLPILISIPIFIWLSSPWIWKEDSPKISFPPILAFILFFFLGIVMNLTLLLAVSWVCLLWAWLKNRLAEDSFARVKKLIILPLMAFPWISLDLTKIGWWFRLSGAWVTARIFSLFGQDVIQEGTFINISGVPISVEAACAGLNTLQSMLIAGIMIAYLFLEKSYWYWTALPQIVLIAWFANTFRVIVLTLAALAVSPEFALGTFHTWGGLLVLAIMFVLCLGLFALQEPDKLSRKS